MDTVHTAMMVDLNAMYNLKLDSRTPRSKPR